MFTHSDNVQKLATAFVAEMQIAESSDPRFAGLLENIRAKNRTPAYLGQDCCASHDFIDANTIMLEAFKKAFGRDPLDAPDGMTQSDADLWNAAWSFARQTGMI